MFICALVLYGGESFYGNLSKMTCSEWHFMRCAADYSLERKAAASVSHRCKGEMYSATIKALSCLYTIVVLRIFYSPAELCYSLKEKMNYLNLLPPAERTDRH